MRAQGLTLIELLIVIAIISILASLAAPSFNALIRKQQVNGEANVLFSLVHLARTEAIKRNSVVTICKSNDANQCGGNWSDGWIVFQDNDKDGSRDAGETLISSGTIGYGYQLSWTAFGSNNYIRFTPQGLTLSQNGSFKLCPGDGDARYARAVIISKTARVRLPKDTNGDGIYEDAGGSNLICA
ncbi:MAG: Tfp pilus assembly protein FimT/FimU [Gammaproteobacteria bacterium]|nr:Tfp pilus assembly protein FimT/FimU [Gammaproteobacteria bacterium]